MFSNIVKLLNKFINILSNNNITELKNMRILESQIDIRDKYVQIKDKYDKFMQYTTNIM
jgi:hypothetical protein